MALPESCRNGREQKWSQCEQGLDYLQLANRWVSKTLVQASTSISNSQGKHKGKLHQSWARLPNPASFKNSSIILQELKYECTTAWLGPACQVQAEPTQQMGGPSHSRHGNRSFYCSGPNASVTQVARGWQPAPEGTIHTQVTLLVLQVCTLLWGGKGWTQKLSPWEGTRWLWRRPFWF